MIYSISGSIPPLSDNLSASIQHLLRNSSYKRTDTDSTEPEGLSTEEDYSKEFKKYEIISSPAFIGILFILFIIINR